MEELRAADSVGETPTDAVETTALPEKSLMIGVIFGRAQAQRWSG